MPGALATAKYFMALEASRMDAMIARRRVRQNRKASRVAMDERLAAVEGQIGEVLLPAMALNRLLVRKGIVTRAELADIAQEVSDAESLEAERPQRTE